MRYDNDIYCDDNIPQSVYDDNDIYGINPLHLVFYTVPNSKSNNDQKLFAEWLYKDFHTCKENGGNECFNNIHSDIRIK